MSRADLVNELCNALLPSFSDASGVLQTMQGAPGEHLPVYMEVAEHVLDLASATGHLAFVCLFGTGVLNAVTAGEIANSPPDDDAVVSVVARLEALVSGHARVYDTVDQARAAVSGLALLAPVPSPAVRLALVASGAVANYGTANLAGELLDKLLADGQFVGAPLALAISTVLCACSCYWVEKNGMFSTLGTSATYNYRSALVQAASGSSKPPMVCNYQTSDALALVVATHMYLQKDMLREAAMCWAVLAYRMGGTFVMRAACVGGAIVDLEQVLVNRLPATNAADEIPPLLHPFLGYNQTYDPYFCGIYMEMLRAEMSHPAYMRHAPPLADLVAIVPLTASRLQRVSGTQFNKEHADYIVMFEANKYHFSPATPRWLIRDIVGSAPESGQFSTLVYAMLDLQGSVPELLRAIVTYFTVHEHPASTEMHRTVTCALAGLFPLALRRTSEPPTAASAKPTATKGGAQGPPSYAQPKAEAMALLDANASLVARVKQMDSDAIAEFRKNIENAAQLEKGIVFRSSDKTPGITRGEVRDAVKKAKQDILTKIEDLLDDVLCRDAESYARAAKDAMPMEGLPGDLRIARSMAEQARQALAQAKQLASHLPMVPSTLMARVEAAVEEAAQVVNAEANTADKPAIGTENVDVHFVQSPADVPDSGPGTPVPVSPPRSRPASPLFSTAASPSPPPSPIPSFNSLSSIVPPGDDAVTPRDVALAHALEETSAFLWMALGNIADWNSGGALITQHPILVRTAIDNAAALDNVFRHTGLCAQLASCSPNEIHDAFGALGNVHVSSRSPHGIPTQGRATIRTEAPQGTLRDWLNKESGFGRGGIKQFLPRAEDGRIHLEHPQAFRDAADDSLALFAQRLADHVPANTERMERRVCAQLMAMISKAAREGHVPDEVMAVLMHGSAVSDYVAAVAMEGLPGDVRVPPAAHHYLRRLYAPHLAQRVRRAIQQHATTRATAHVPAFAAEAGPHDPAVLAEIDAFVAHAEFGTAMLHYATLDSRPPQVFIDYHAQLTHLVAQNRQHAPLALLRELRTPTQRMASLWAEIVQIEHVATQLIATPALAGNLRNATAAVHDLVHEWSTPACPTGSDSRVRDLARRCGAAAARQLESLKTTAHLVSPRSTPAEIAARGSMLRGDCAWLKVLANVFDPAGAIGDAVAPAASARMAARTVPPHLAGTYAPTLADYARFVALADGKKATPEFVKPLLAAVEKVHEALVRAAGALVAAKVVPDPTHGASDIAHIAHSVLGTHAMLSAWNASLFDAHLRCRAASVARIHLDRGLSVQPVASGTGIDTMALQTARRLRTENTPFAEAFRQHATGWTGQHDELLAFYLDDSVAVRNAALVRVIENSFSELAPNDPAWRVFMRILEAAARVASGSDHKSTTVGDIGAFRALAAGALEHFMYYSRQKDQCKGLHGVIKHKPYLRLSYLEEKVRGIVELLAVDPELRLLIKNTPALEQLCDHIDAVLTRIVESASKKFTATQHIPRHAECLQPDEIATRRQVTAYVAQHPSAKWAVVGALERANMPAAAAVAMKVDTSGAPHPHPHRAVAVAVKGHQAAHALATRLSGTIAPNSFAAAARSELSKGGAGSVSKARLANALGGVRDLSAADAHRILQEPRPAADAVPTAAQGHVAAYEREHAAEEKLHALAEQLRADAMVTTNSEEAHVLHAIANAAAAPPASLSPELVLDCLTAAARLAEGALGVHIATAPVELARIVEMARTYNAKRKASARTNAEQTCTALECLAALEADEVNTLNDARRITPLVRVLVKAATGGVVVLVHDLATVAAHRGPAPVTYAVPTENVAALEQLLAANPRHVTPDMIAAALRVRVACPGGSPVSGILCVNNAHTAILLKEGVVCIPA